MRDVHPEQAPYWLGGLLEAISVDGGPTDEQLRILQALLRGYFGFDGSIDLVPLPAGELARRITDPGSRYRFVQTLNVLQFCRHPASEALATSVEQTARTLGVDEPMLQVAHDAAEHSRELVMADWIRFKQYTAPEPRIREVTDDELASRMGALHRCPAGSLGRAFVDFYDEWELPQPVNDPQSIQLVNHDFAHVISGYQPNEAVEEVALSALLVSSTDGERHFSTLVASMALYEVGLMEYPGIAATKGALSRPGAPEVFADAWRRGASCTHDIVAFDHLAVADWPLDDVRKTLGVPPRSVWPDGQPRPVTG